MKSKCPCLHYSKVSCKIKTTVSNNWKSFIYYSSMSQRDILGQVHQGGYNIKCVFLKTTMWQNELLLGSPAPEATLEGSSLPLLAFTAISSGEKNHQEKRFIFQKIRKIPYLKRTKHLYTYLYLHIFL